MSTEVTRALREKVPSVPKAIAMLVAMEKELTNAKTYEAIQRTIKEATVLKVLLDHVDEVKEQAENTILVAHVRIGEELSKVPKGAGRPKKISSRTGTNSGRQATGVMKTARHRHGKLAAAGVTKVKDTAAKLRKQGKDPTPRAVATELAYGDKKERRDVRLGQLAAKAWPAGLFSIISADPAWPYETWSDKGMDRAADNHYPTMTLDDIMALPVADLAAKDALLTLWVTVPHMMSVQPVLDAWGFRYSSMLTWDKEVAAHGHWFRNQTEHLIFATRGSFPLPPDDIKLTSLWREKKGKHSAKPIGILDWLDKAYPGLPKVELFARTARPGWTSWGNQLPEE